MFLLTASDIDLIPGYTFLGFKTAAGRNDRMEVRCISKTQFYLLARIRNVKGGIMASEKLTISWKPVQF